MRTSIKTLETLCEWINKATNSPLTPYTRTEDGKFRANIGNFHLSQAYGGVCLHRMHNDGGGVTCPLGNGHISKKELEAKMRAFLLGLEYKQTES